MRYKFHDCIIIILKGACFICPDLLKKIAGVWFSEAGYAKKSTEDIHAALEQFQNQAQKVTCMQQVKILGQTGKAPILNYFIIILIGLSFCAASAAQPDTRRHDVPAYILKGLEKYKHEGYAAAVRTWLKNSPYEAGTQMASQIAFFKNIEMLYGKYLSYNIISTLQTDTSNRVYVRMNFERTAGYILFTSIRKNGAWVLAHIDLDRVQKYAATQ